MALGAVDDRGNKAGYQGGVGAEGAAADHLVAVFAGHIRDRRKVHVEAEGAQLLCDGLAHFAGPVDVLGFTDLRHGLEGGGLQNGGHGRHVAAFLVDGQEGGHFAALPQEILGAAQQILDLLLILQVLLRVDDAAHGVVQQGLLGGVAGLGGGLHAGQGLRRDEEHLIDLLLQGHPLQQLHGTALLRRLRLGLRLRLGFRFGLLLGDGLRFLGRRFLLQHRLGVAEVELIAYNRKNAHSDQKAGNGS